MDVLKERMKLANLKALIIGRWTLGVVAVSCIAIPMLVASWLAAMSAENGSNRRYAACVLGLLFQVAATGASCMGLTFLTTQQRIVVFIDKGILDGIKGRTNDMQQLPP